MKYPTKRLHYVLAVALVIACLISITVPAAAVSTAAAPTDATYGIAITCSYSDIEENDTVDRSIYEENVFLLTSKTSGQYATAEYHKETQTYDVTGYTDSKDNATSFHCGTDANLRLNGLAPDTYLLDHTKTHSGYATISDVEITLTADVPTVNGTALTIQTDPGTGETIVPFQIGIGKDNFRLPATCYWCSLQRDIEDGSYTVPFLIKTTLLLVLSFWILRKVCWYKPAKLLAIGTLLPQILLLVLFFLATIGYIQITHSSGPFLSTIVLVAHLLYIALGCTAYVIYILKSDDTQ